MISHDLSDHSHQFDVGFGSRSREFCDLQKVDQLDEESELASMVKEKI
jgi:hypothetical protein